MLKLGWQLCIVLGSALGLSEVASAAITCPEMPDKITQVNRDVRSDIQANVGALGKLKAGEVTVKTDVIAKNLFDKYPNVDRILVAQMMAATYCSLIRESKSMSDVEKQERWEKFQERIFQFISPASTGTVATKPVASPDPAKPTRQSGLRISQVLYGRDDTGRFMSIILNNLTKRKYVVQRIVYSRGRSSEMDRANSYCCPYCGGGAIYVIDEFESTSGATVSDQQITFRESSVKTESYSGRVAFSEGCGYPTFAQLELPVAVSISEENTFNIKVYIRQSKESSDDKATQRDKSPFKLKEIIAAPDTVCVYLYTDGTDRLQFCTPEKEVVKGGLFL